VPEEPDDEGARGEPPHPLDRVWFHPSEISAYMATAPAVPRRPTREWSLAAVAAVLGAAVTVGILAAAGGLDGGSTNISPVGVATAVSGFGEEPIAQLVAESGGSIVSVRARGADPAASPAAASGVALGRVDVLTTASVLVGATKVTVSTGGRVLDADVVGVDLETDLALLHVKGGELTPAQLGSAKSLVVGQAVVGLGITSGDHRWAGTGVVSALDRIAIGANGTVMPGMIETDLSPGTPVAGGALLDASGAIVGLLSGAAPGRALPIEWARDLAEQLAAGGMAHHGWLGVDTVDADERAGGGALVTALAAGSPAEAAGLAPGDVVTAIGDERITDMADLLAAVSHRRPGDPVVITAWRGDDRIRKDADLAERP